MATIPNQTQGQTTDYQAAPPFTSRAPGLTFDRHFTRPGISPYDEIVWELRDAVIQDFKGKVIFEQKNVEVPADWSMTATNIVASKYLHGLNGTTERESGVRALITLSPEALPKLSVDARALLFTLAISILACLFFGLAPGAWHVTPNRVSRPRRRVAGDAPRCGCESTRSLRDQPGRDRLLDRRGRRPLDP